MKDLDSVSQLRASLALNEHQTYLLWSVVTELSRMSAKLVTLAALRSWKLCCASRLLLTTEAAHKTIEPYRS